MLTYQICFHLFPTNKVWISGQYVVQLVRAKTLIVSYAIYQAGFSLRGKCNLLHLACSTPLLFEYPFVGQMQPTSPRIPFHSKYFFKITKT